MTTARGAPPWLADGLGAMRDELRAYVATAWAFARRPHLIAPRWWRGEVEVMNPLAMLATGAALVAAAQQLASAVLGLPEPDGLIAVVMSVLGPYVYYVAIGALCHVALRGGTREVALLDTVAIALFAGAGPAAVAQALAWGVVCALAPVIGHREALTGIVLGAAFSVFCLSLSTGLGALHRSPWWRMVLAFTLALVVTGVAFGLLRPPGTYGLHWVITVDDGPGLDLGM
jgi:hypothetical protein